MTDAELASLLADAAKWIDGDIVWVDDEDHSLAVEFQVTVQSDAGYPLVVRARYNSAAGKTSFSIIHRGAGRILGLDLGTAHHNPSCQTLSGAHWQRWSERYGTKEAVAAPDLDLLATDPVSAWQVFCSLASITHRGVLRPPPPRPREL
jgi:hypothetical protein